MVLEDNLTNTKRELNQELEQTKRELQETKLQQQNNLEAQRQRFNTLIDKLKGPNGETLRFATGSTEPGNTQWIQHPPGAIYSSHSIYVDIDISSAGFSEKPFYFTSIGGIAGHWDTTGATSIYKTENKELNESFRIYLHFTEQSPMTPTLANEWKWHIQWLAVGI